MSVRASVLTLSCAVAALGLGYWAYVNWGTPSEEPTGTLTSEALSRAADTEGASSLPQDQLEGSADRRMDDFGSGPAGKVVTMPLEERHHQAFGGSARGAGGGVPDPKAPQTPDGTAGTPDITDSLASLNMVTGEEERDAGSNEAANYRVIERETTPEAETSGAVTGETNGEDAVETAPSFDIVRVDPEGNTILAGRSSPFADVEVKAGNIVIDRVKATAIGEWVSSPLKPLESGDQELSLVASAGDQRPVLSREVVVVSIPEANEDQTRAQIDEPVAILLDKEKGGEGRILQAPGQLQGEGQLVLKMVDYNDEGAIKLSGEAPADVPIRIYLDNEPAALVISDSNGTWVTTLDRDLPGGDYILRLDQLDTEGETVARLETPFTRVTAPPIEGHSKVDYVVVQPGNSLWRIARRLSGDGFNYVYIFEANQGQIRDPDVIYPGQVFEVPADSGIAG